MPYENVNAAPKPLELESPVTVDFSALNTAKMRELFKPANDSTSSAVLPEVTIDSRSPRDLARLLRDPEMQKLVSGNPALQKTIDRIQANPNSEEARTFGKNVSEFLKTCDARKQLSSHWRPELSSNELKEIWAHTTTKDRFEQICNSPEMRRLMNVSPSARSVVDNYLMATDEKKVMSSFQKLDEFARTCDTRKLLSSSDKPVLSNNELKEIWYHTMTRERFDSIVKHPDTQRLFKMSPEARAEAERYKMTSDPNEVLRIYKRFNEFAKECQNYRNGHAAVQPFILDFEIKSAWQYSNRPRRR